MSAEFVVRAAAGSLRSNVRADAVLPHRWTAEGVAVELQFTGGHLLHLAVAGCVLNDLYREAGQGGIELRGVLVTACGDFDRQTWRSTGISYEVELDSPAPADDLERLRAHVDRVAEIPAAVRAGVAVTRTS